jgi:UDP-N-acetylmuramoylalanine--D-glutamate ligase
MINLKDKKVLVVGLGRTGYATAKFLIDKSAMVTVTDILPATGLDCIDDLKGMGISVECGGHNVETFLSSDLIIVSPGVTSGLPALEKARECGIETISEIELAAGFIDSPILAVTGTNGKTTTTTLLGNVFSAAGRKVFVGGNIGVPLVEYLLSDEVADDVIVEVSSFQLEGVKKFRPNVAVLLNVTPDHMDRYPTMEEYCTAKFKIFSNQKAGDIAVFNYDDRMIMSRVQMIEEHVRTIPFSISKVLDEGVYYSDGEIIYSNNGVRESYPTTNFKLRGLHNLENIMAVIAVARGCDIPREKILNAVETFSGLPHRMEVVRKVDDVLYFNDSKGTNIGALIRTLESISGPIILIAGGKDKGGDYNILKEHIIDKVKLLILIGEARDRIKNALEGCVEIKLADALEEAVRIASSRSAAGDTVLLSPACSSFDMFKNFEERGDEFKRLVSGL